MFEKILSKIGGKTIKEVTNLAGNFITTDKDKARFKNILTDIVLKYNAQVIQAQSEILKTEMTGNWLQRSWRPIIMLSFGFIILYYYFLSPVFGLPGIDLPDRFWSLLEIGLGGYVIGRSVEKISDRVTKNIDLNMLRKRDRKSGSIP